ncbi:MAG: 4Fe-4S binding protein [Planctomycetes bacterium]|jgi:polyferredoxin|nr:4Fe-4S binding protein [Planctomycetota bacterium]
MKRLALTALLLAAGWGASALAVELFPPPDFSGTDYEFPPTQVYAARPAWLEYLDMAVLAIGLGVTAWLVLRQRHRRWLVAMGVSSLLYFGFFRTGCVCPIGAIQNVAAAMVDDSYAIPLVVLVFFGLPLLASLFHGRTFCAAICPLGAIQDMVIWKPLRIPRWLDHTLGLGAWVVLALGVLFAATGSAFVICRYDPFVGIFRFGGSFRMIILGASLLAMGLFVARPYCRFICPLGAILRVTSRVSRHHASVTPNECIQCRLCENACPFDAIDPPEKPAGAQRRRGKRRLAGLLLATPIIVAVATGLGWLVSGGHLLGMQWESNLSRANFTVNLHDRITAERAGTVEGRTDASEAFYATEDPLEQKLARLNAQTAAIKRRFRWGGLAMGAFLGLVIVAKLISLVVRRTHEDYRPNRALCLACGRCYRYCPVEQQRRGNLPDSEIRQLDRREDA